MKLTLSDFDFDLSPELIAQTPASPRDASSLLCYDRGTGAQGIYKFKEIVDLLPEKCVLVFNDTKVYKARLVFEYKDRECEVFFLSETEALVRPGKYFTEGARIMLPGDIELEVLRVMPDGSRCITLNADDVYAYLEKNGEVPIPPYIKSNDANKFESDYQTVYAEKIGSSAAPTAGLHFTENLLDKIKSKGIKFEHVNLCVGLGTFAPLRNDVVDENKLHSEFITVAPDVAERLNKYKADGFKVISVGTTTLRTLQSCWDGNCFNSFEGETDIFIYPEFSNWSVDGLITNFHLPKSSLFIFICAFLGTQEAHELYEYAISNQLRFYSFGDACLFFR